MKREDDFDLESQPIVAKQTLKVCLKLKVRLFTVTVELAIFFELN